MTPKIDPDSSNCHNCHSNRHNHNHHLRIRGVPRRLCSPCVLSTHPSLFCPLCLETHHPHHLLEQRTIRCSRCPSTAHLSCAIAIANPHSHSHSHSPSSFTFTCPSHARPQFLADDDDGDDDDDDDDDDDARVLVAAARIASLSLRRAAAARRAEAEWRAKEAALAWKRAREALERLDSLNWDGQEQESHQSAVMPNITNNNKPKRKKSSKKDAAFLTNGGDALNVKLRDWVNMKKRNKNK